MRSALLSCVALAAILLAAPCQGWAAPQSSSPKAAATAEKTVYDGQPDMTEKELSAFIKDLPEFRSWARAHGETAQPVRKGNRPDVSYSPAAGAWLTAKGWNPRRFFCIMGRTAAGAFLLSEGADRGSAGSDMPVLTKADTELVRAHLGELLKTGSETGSEAAAPVTPLNMDKDLKKLQEKPSLPPRPDGVLSPEDHVKAYKAKKAAAASAPQKNGQPGSGTATGR